jgi:hypothetical protein
MPPRQAGGKEDPMSTTTFPPETTDEHLSGEDTPVVANKGEHGDVVDVPPLKENPLLAPSTQETTPGRALRPHEALSSTLALVLVRGVEHGKVIVLPGYYACVGTMPCAATEYYLLVRWEHRENGQRGERRVVLPEHIRVLDRETLLLPPPDAASGTSATAAGLSAALPDNPLHPIPESTSSTHGAGQSGNERYPQLQHSAKRKS